MSVRLVIETEKKGRSFSALVLCRVYAPCAWASGIRENGRHRPAMMLLGCTHDEASAVAANLREGRKMRLFGGGMSSKGESCEVLRSEHFAIAPQRTEEGTLLLVRHPTLFVYSPGMTEDYVRFVCLPPRALVVRQSLHFDVSATQAHLEACGFVPWSEKLERDISWGRVSGVGKQLVHGIGEPLFPTFSALLVASIAQRMGVPILPEPLFWAQFTAALFHAGLAMQSVSRRYDEEMAPYHEVDCGSCGFFPGAAVSATSAQIAELLATETQRYLRLRSL